MTVEGSGLDVEDHGSLLGLHQRPGDLALDLALLDPLAPPLVRRAARAVRAGRLAVPGPAGAAAGTAARRLEAPEHASHQASRIRQTVTAREATANAADARRMAAPRPTS